MKKNILTFIVIAVLAILAYTQFAGRQASAPTIESQPIVEQEQAEQTEETVGTQPDTTTQASSEAEQETLTEDNETPQTMTATFTTNKGAFEVELFNELAPKTVENFTKLAKEGFYDGVKFHRVIQGFMIQTGDPLSKDDDMMDRWGTGGPGYQFEDEIHAENNNAVGTISMANAGPNTNGSQFFINAAPNDFLDTKHTVFGKVVSGMEVVTEIENSETGLRDMPVEPIIINSIKVN